MQLMTEVMTLFLTLNFVPRCLEDEAEKRSGLEIICYCPTSSSVRMVSAKSEDIITCFDVIFLPLLEYNVISKFCRCLKKSNKVTLDSVSVKMKFAPVVTTRDLLR